MFTWLADNWEGIALCCFVISTVISEVMTFINTPSNGIAQSIVNLFNRLSRRK